MFRGRGGMSVGFVAWVGLNFLGVCRFSGLVLAA